MTYSDITKQSPETQAAVEQEVRVLLKVSFLTALSDVAQRKHKRRQNIVVFIRLQPFFLIQDSYERAKNILKTYSKEHKTLADALLRYETLDAKEIQLVLEGKSLDH